MGREIVAIYVVLDFLLIAISLIIGKNWLLNTQISFFCTLFIAYATFKTYKGKVQDELLSGKYDDFDEWQDDEEMDKKDKSFSLVFFSPFKLASYGLLALSFYMLVKFNLISPVAFFIGVIPMPLGALIYGAFLSKQS